MDNRVTARSTTRSGSGLRESDASTARKYPDDFEVQTFYAFAVLGVGYATPNDTTLSKQIEAAGILEKLWKQNAKDPGVVHYLIHSYDYPRFAQRGLTAAQTYDSSRPGCARAAYVVSHLYTPGNVG